MAQIPRLDDIESATSLQLSTAMAPEISPIVLTIALFLSIACVMLTHVMH
jgi:hypothetical protein